jgi:hypothetical protein
MKITIPAGLPDTGKNALPPIQPLGGRPLVPIADEGNNAPPAWGGATLESKHEYSEAPYSNAATSFADAVTKQ